MIQLAHDTIRGQIRKYRASYKTAEEIDSALYRSLMDFYNKLFLGQRNSQQLSHYLSEQICDITTSNSFDLNLDFNRPVIIKSVVGQIQYEGDILAENEWMDRLNSVIIPPSLEKPIARVLGDKIEFYPGDAGNFVLVYYRSPVKPEYKYTVDGNGRDITFNPTGSVDLDVNKNSINNVISGALAYLGVSLKDDSLLMEKQINGN
jgi:hypothetical protein